MGGQMSLRHCVSFPLGIYSEGRWLDTWEIYKSFFKEPLYCFPEWVYEFTFIPTVYCGLLFSTGLPTLVVSRLVDDSHSTWCEVIPPCGFDLLSLRICKPWSVMRAMLIGTT